MISVMLAGSASRLNQLSVVSDWNEGGEPPEPRILGGPAAKSKAKGGLFPFGDLFIKEGSLFLIIILASSEVLRKIMGGAVVVTLESSDEQSLAKTIQNANDPFATPNSREVPLGRARFTVFGRRASNSFLAPFYANRRHRFIKQMEPNACSSMSIPMILLYFGLASVRSVFT